MKKLKISYLYNLCIKKTAHNKAYALHSLAVVRATPNRGDGAAATSHKQNVVRHAGLNARDIGNTFVARHR